MKILLVPLLACAILAIGCQKDIKEVRRTDPDKYDVNGGTSYSAGGFRPGAPSAPRLEPKALGTPARKAARG